MDDLLYQHAQSIFGDAEPLEDHDPDEVDLGYPFGLAYDLWSAWDKHGKMARAGGYLDQPRRWQRMIHLMNRRFHFAFERANEDHDPDRQKREREEDFDYRELMRDEIGFSWSELPRG